MKKLLILLMLTFAVGLEARHCCRGGGVVVVERYGYGTPYQAFYPNPYGPPPYWGNPYWGYPYYSDPYYPYRGGGGFYFQMNFR